MVSDRAAALTVCCCPSFKSITFARPSDVFALGSRFASRVGGGAEGEKQLQTERARPVGRRSSAVTDDTSTVYNYVGLYAPHGLTTSHLPTAGDVRSREWI